MEFRIKNTYQYRCKKSLSNGNFLSSEIPELIFAWSDENAIENTLKDNISIGWDVAEGGQPSPAPLSCVQRAQATYVTH